MPNSTIISMKYPLQCNCNCHQPGIALQCDQIVSIRLFMLKYSTALSHSFTEAKHLGIDHEVTLGPGQRWEKGESGLAIGISRDWLWVELRFELQLRFIRIGVRQTFAAKNLAAETTYHMFPQHAPIWAPQQHQSQAQNTGKCHMHVSLALWPAQWSSGGSYRMKLKEERR